MEQPTGLIHNHPVAIPLRGDCVLCQLQALAPDMVLTIVNTASELIANHPGMYQGIDHLAEMVARINKALRAAQI